MEVEKATQPNGTIIYGDPSVSTVTVEKVGNVLLTPDYWMCDFCTGVFNSGKKDRCCTNCENERGDAPDAFVVEIVGEYPENISTEEIGLYEIALDDFFSEDPEMLRPGFVGRPKFSLNLDDKDIVDFMMERKDKTKEKIWKSRWEVITYFHEIERMGWDDIDHMFWYDKQECRKRNLKTGKLIPNQ